MAGWAGPLLAQALREPGRVVSTTDTQGAASAQGFNWAGLLCAPAPMSVWLGHGVSLDAAPRVDDPRDARLAFTRAAHTPSELWQALGQRGGPGGSPAAAMLVIDVPQLVNDPPPPRQEPTDRELTPRIALSMPASHGQAHLAVGGLGRHFWRARAARRQWPPAGAITLILVCGACVVAVPDGADVTLLG